MVLSERESSARRPEDRVPEPDEPEVQGEGPETIEHELLVLDLARALEIGVSTNRTFIAQKENLFLEALSLFEARHSFSPLLSSSISYLYADGDGIPETHSGSLLAGVSQILDTGGTLSLDGSTSYFRSDDPTLTTGERTFDSSLTVRLLQPLLRGAGYEPSHEALTQAERNLVYAIRDFELFREDFSIDVATRYYDLVQQKQSIENVRRNLEDFQFGERQAQALFDVGRTSELDVLRARRNRLDAENQLIEAIESYQLSLDRFRVFLGLPADEPIEVEEFAPDFVPVVFDVDSAVEVALENRLDLRNREEQLEDDERFVRLSRNDLLPALDLDASVNVPAGPDSGFSNQRFSGENASLGLTLEIPVDRVSERSAYRRAQIFRVQAQRSFEEFRDNLVVEIESAFRELERREQSLKIQRQQIEDELKNVRIAQLRFERGEIPNRDVVEAQQSQLDARNSLIREQVNYEIARLQLLADLGILFIDERGMWSE